MRVRMLGVVFVAVALALTFARPMEARSQEPVPSQMAEDLEAAAVGLHAQPEPWADAARRAALEAARARASSGGDAPEARRLIAHAA